MRSNILFISERSEDAHCLTHMLHALPMVLTHAGSLRQARIKLKEGRCDLILTEARLPDGNWLDVLHLARDCPRDLEVVVTDAVADAHFWAEALNLGAYDLITQPFYEPEVRRILTNACSHVSERHPAMAV